MSVAALLGFAQNAGRLATGLDAALRAVRSRRARLLVLAEDASERLGERVREAAAAARIPLVRWGTKAGLGALLGRRDVGVVAVCDAGFAGALLKAAQATRESGPEPSIK